ncbi:hypothetical protein [Agrococcus versicolor]|uniref:hypothetical protein n=1 Tax=Agrococcus versicolor TaxID=501482 RepID=UPI0031D494F8
MLDDRRQVLVATNAGPTPGPTLQALVRRLSDRLRARVDIMVTGLSEPWSAVPAGPDPIDGFEQRISRLESAPMSFVVGTLRATERAARDFESRVTPIVPAVMATESGHRFVRYEGEVDIADMISSRPLFSIAIGEDRVDVACHARGPVLRRRGVVWRMIWVGPSVGIFDEEGADLAESARGACLARQLHARIRPRTDVDPGFADARGLDEEGAATLQALLDDDPPDIDAHRIVVALGLPADLASAIRDALAT